jgi:histone acetyltransferase MYST1
LARHAHLCTCPHLFPPAKEHASSKPHHDKPHDDASPVALGDEEDEDGVRKSRRKRKNEDEEDDGDDPTVVADMEHDEHEGMDEASLKEHEEVTKVKNVRTIELGRHVMETWYFSPFPKEYYPLGFIDRLYFCEYSLRFFCHKSELNRYQARGVDPHPPGNEIYRKNGLAMFEVDGGESTEYCQNLCYMAKLFLDHKTLYYDVDPFLFYVMCEYDDRGFHPTGYFSKEKYSDVGYNLACILTFPCYQRKGCVALRKLHCLYHTSTAYTTLPLVCWSLIMPAVRAQHHPRTQVRALSDLVLLRVE